MFLNVFLKKIIFELILCLILRNCGRMIVLLSWICVIFFSYFVDFTEVILFGFRCEVSLMIFLRVDIFFQQTLLKWICLIRREVVLRCNITFFTVYLLVESENILSNTFILCIVFFKSFSWSYNFSFESFAKNIYYNIIYLKFWCIAKGYW